MQNRHVTARLLRIIGIVRPRINSRGFGMAYKLKYFYDAFPNRLTLEFLFDGHTLDVLRLHAMQTANHVLQFEDVSGSHCYLFGNSDISQSIPSLSKWRFP